MIRGVSVRLNFAWSAPAGVLLTALLLSGCWGGSSGPVVPQFKGSTVPIKGVVTLDGEPLGNADVTFTFEGTPPEGFISSGGKTDSTGKFVVRSLGKEGTPPGRYRVSISCLATKDGAPFRDDPENGMDLEQLRMSGGLKELVPVRYSDPVKSQLTIEITEGQTDPVDFVLKSK